MHEKNLKKKIDELRPHDQYMTTKIRGLCREFFEQALPNIAAIAKGEADDCSHNAQIRALETLGKYGLGTHGDVAVEHGEWLRIAYMSAARNFDSEEKFMDWMADFHGTLQHRE